MPSASEIGPDNAPVNLYSKSALRRMKDEYDQQQRFKKSGSCKQIIYDIQKMGDPLHAKDDFLKSGESPKMKAGFHRSSNTFSQRLIKVSSPHKTLDKFGDRGMRSSQQTTFSNRVKTAG